MSPSALLAAARRRLLVAIAVAVLGPAVLAGPAAAEVVWAVGDGGVTGPEDDAVAAFIERRGAFDRLLYLGDVYETGTAQEYRDNYGPSFGRFRSLTSPTPGNHEWGNRATGYDPYWGSLAPQTAGGHYYSFDLAGWHFVSLNSEEDASAESAQVAWLRRDLSRYAGTCTIAFWHRPRYSAGPTTEEKGKAFEPFWAALSGHAVIALAGHDHNYQRLRPERGITPLVVGTGGRSRHTTNESDPRLEAVDDQSTGALRMVLEPGRASFEQFAADGRRIDSGSVGCRAHATASPSPSPASAPAPPPAPAPAPAPSPAPLTPAPAVTARLRILAPRSGRTYSRRLRVVRGTATVPEGAAIRLALTRRRGRSCVSWDGRRFRRASCRRPPLFTPAGAERWKARLRERPRPGSYRLTARVVGDNGVLARATTAFRVR